VAERPVEVTTGRLRTLLAVLALSAGRAVTVDRLAGAIWGEELPDDVRRSVRTYVTRLRSLLGAQAITNEPAGYVLHANVDDIDALRFLRLLEEAGRAPDPVAERLLLNEALTLWRGAPLEGIRSEWLDETETPRLLEQYLSALERRIDMDIADGLQADVVAELRELTARYPLRESLWVRLLTVMSLSGRHAEALEQYERVRSRIADDLGTDPGPELQAIYAKLLAGEQPETARSARMPSAALVAPRLLPADIHVFAGRVELLERLDGLLAHRNEDQPAAVVISAIAGMAGIGKTTLAVHWAHRVADQFPDGQLYVNLHGFDPTRPPTTPAEAIRGFLDALQVPSSHLPQDLDAQTNLYRSILAGRRVLVVLDNAHDAEQVRPLLPGAPGCMVLVTSRNQLSGLVAAEGAHPIMLDLLPTHEAQQLLARRLGANRVDAEPRAVNEIVEACARLPLALAVVAARAAARPAFTLEIIAAELRQVRGSLDAFTSLDSTIDVRAVFSWSYRQLTDDAARLFRLLGLHPGPEVSTPAAASLAGIPVHQLRRLMDELCEANLVFEHAPGRYGFHDLLRAYAMELARAVDSESGRREALQRLTDHYMHTAHTAAMLVSPYLDAISLEPAHDSVTTETLTNRDQALAWFTTEYAVLLATINTAANAEFDAYICHVAWALLPFLDLRGYWQDWAAVQQAALKAADRLGDRSEQAAAHRNLAGAYLRLMRHDDTHRHLQYALDLYVELGDVVSQARTRLNLSTVFDAEGDHASALDHAQRALELYRASGHRYGEARALNGIGWDMSRLGDHEQALPYCEQALHLYQELEDYHGQAETWDSLGYVHNGLGHHKQVIACYTQALRLWRAVNDRVNEADTLIRFGQAYRDADDDGSAWNMWQRAWEILVELGDPRADDVRAKLDELHQTTQLSRR
jgi:DNA-binding SARP family transcriptional activator/Tfp pilus assembly protein PilF